jgi:hypothetical protein
MNKTLLALLLILSSCLDRYRVLELFDAQATLAFFKATAPEFAHAELLGETISKPEGLRIELLRARLPQQSSLCLNYEVPDATRKKLGSIFLIKIKEQDNCLSSIGEALGTLENVSDLSINSTDNELQLNFIFAGEKQKLVWEYLAANPLSKNYQRYDRPSERVLKIVLGPKSSSLELARDNAPYIEARPIWCHRVNNSCEDVLSFQCDLCPGPWYEVIDHSCPQGGSKACGSERCGERGNPACILGRSDISVDKGADCVSGSILGHCGPGLVAHCDEEGVLVCL